jgi:hypothetical protein
MKKIFTLLIACAALVSCQDDVMFNNPGFQATVNNALWKATYEKVVLDRSGSLSIKGMSTSHVLELNLQNSAVGKYVLGTTNQTNKVTFYPIKDTDAVFSTGLTSAPVSAVHVTSGGSGYATSSLVPTSGGSGAGLKVNITANSSGVVTAVQINVAGEGYEPGDIVTINGGGNNAQFEVVSVAKSGGEIIITENTGKTISGTFKFTAFEEATGDVVSCREGIFYKLPIE